MADLVVAGAVTEPDDGQPGALGGDERHVNRDAVGEQDGNPGAAGEAGSCEDARQRGGAFVVGGPGGSAAVGHERVAVGSRRGPARDRVAHGGVAPPACGTVRGGDRGIGLHPEPSTTPGRSVPPAT